MGLDEIAICAKVVRGNKFHSGSWRFQVPGKAAAVIVTERQKLILEQFGRATTIAVRLQKRARIILLAFEKQLNRDIAETVQLGTDQVGLWRNRWLIILNARCCNRR